MGFFADFSGKSAQKDLKKANANAEAALAAGRAQADVKFNQAYDEFTPYTAMGKDGMADNAMYRQAIGLGTDEQRTAAQGRYFSDPAFQQINNNQQNAMLRNLNARGLSGSGVAAQAGSNTAYGGYTGWLDRLRESGQQGTQTGVGVAGARAGIRGQQADMAYGYGGTRSNMLIQGGNAMAGTRNILSNNILSLAGTAAKAYAAA